MPKHKSYQISKQKAQKQNNPSEYQIVSSILFKLQQNNQI